LLRYKYFKPNGIYRAFDKKKKKKLVYPVAAWLVTSVKSPFAILV